MVFVCNEFIFPYKPVLRFYNMKEKKLFISGILVLILPEITTLKYIHINTHTDTHVLLVNRVRTIDGIFHRR